MGLSGSSMNISDSVATLEGVQRLKYAPIIGTAKVMAELVTSIAQLQSGLAVILQLNPVVGKQMEQQIENLMSQLTTLVK